MLVKDPFLRSHFMRRSAPKETAGTTPAAPAPSAPAEVSGSELAAFLPGGDLLAGSVTTAPAPAASEEDETTGAAVIDEKEDEGEESKPKDEQPESKEAPPEEPEDAETKGWPESAQKRVDKLTALKGEAERARDEATARATKAEEDLATLKAQGPAAMPAPTPENPLAGVADEAGLTAHARFASDLADWAMDHIAEGGTMPPDFDAIVTGRTVEEAKAEPREFTVEETRALWKQANRRLNQDVPQRRQWLQVEQQARSYVAQHYPQMLKADTEEGKLYAQFTAQFPAIKALPTWPVAMVDYVRGAQLRIADEQARKNPTKGAATPKKEDVPIAPAMPGAPRGSAVPKVEKPRRTVELSASMDAEQLAGAL